MQSRYLAVFNLFVIGGLLTACSGATNLTEPTRTQSSSATEAAEEEGEEAEATFEPVSTMTVDKATELSDLGWIAFTSSQGGRRDVYLIRPDGSDEINLTGELPNTFAEAPVWSPDGTIIAFDGVPNSDVLRDIYLVNVSVNPEQFQITTLPGFDCYPSFSPDGQQIVYMSERDGNRDLFIMDLEGTDTIQLTDEPTYDYEPSWSPDGEHILFVSRRSGESEIYVMDVDGSNVRRLTESPKLDWRPVWSPDGEWIVFESWRTGNGDIYLMRPDGSDLQQLTTSGAEDGNPTFSPDGRFIVFHSQRTGNYQLFIMAVDDPENQWLLNTGSVRSLLPVWSPVTEIADIEKLIPTVGESSSLN
jgi:Tol biopolymer transport system component